MQSVSFLHVTMLRTMRVIEDIYAGRKCALKMRDRYNPCPC